LPSCLIKKTNFAEVIYKFCTKNSGFIAGVNSSAWLKA